jgi:hypothetical protein
MKEKLKKAVTSPLTALSVVGSFALAVVPAAEPLWTFLSATAGTWFPIASVSGGVILPEVGYPEIGSTLLLMAAAAYVTVYLDKFVDKVQEWRN